MDRLFTLEEYKAIEAMDSIVFVDPGRIEAGSWFRDAQRSWQSEIASAPARTLAMPGLGTGLAVPALYERVEIAPRSRLVWET